MFIKFIKNNCNIFKKRNLVNGFVDVKVEKNNKYRRYATYQSNLFVVIAMGIIDERW